ncbi:hypothetical protein D3C81_1255610 [compost metagenome]
MGIGINRADDDQVPSTQLAGPLAVGHHQVKVHFTECLLGAGLLERAAQAAVGDVHAPLELRQKLGEFAYRILQVRVFGQWPAGRGEHPADRGFVEQPIEQMLSRQAGSAGNQDMLRRQVHDVSPLIQSA